MNTKFAVIKATGQKVVVREKKNGFYTVGSISRTFRQNELDIIDVDEDSTEVFNSEPLPSEAVRQFLEVWGVRDPKKRAETLLQHRKDYLFAHLFPALFEDWNENMSDFSDYDIVDDCLRIIDYYLSGKTKK